MTFQDILIPTIVTCLYPSNCPVVSAFLTLLLQMWTSARAGLLTGVHRNVSTLRDPTSVGVTITSSPSTVTHASVVLKVSVRYNHFITFNSNTHECSAEG